MIVQADALTGLPNREMLTRAIESAIEGGEPLALAVLDIDHFEEINSGFGHEVGDTVLRTLAGTLAESAPGAVYRVSGDEFAVMLPGLTLEQAFLQMERARARVQAAASDFGLPDGRAVTISIGVAQCPRDARHARGLLEAADVALGAVKEQGRNQVGLPLNEEMVMKSCYYPATSLRRLKALAERLKRTESSLLREALDDLFRKQDIPRA